MAPAPQSLPSETMARTYPLSLPYNQCLGAKEDPYSFSSMYVEDLRNGDAEYLSTVQQLTEAIPKMLDPASRFSLRGQVTPSGHQRQHHSMRAALWWILASDGDFRRASSGLHYYLARQGRRVVLRGGDVTHPCMKAACIGSMTPRRLHLAAPFGNLLPSCLSDPTECTATPALSCPNSWLACWLVRQLADRGGESLKVDPRRI